MAKRFVLGEGIWQLLDQLAVSAGNFLTGMVLARTLYRSEFGIFSLLFMTLFTINTCHLSLVVYPLVLSISRAEPAKDTGLSGRRSSEQQP